MNARDVMTTGVVSVNPDTPIRRVAELLLEYGISAVPVVDNTGAAIGIVSEGDLMGRKITERDERRDWWLQALAQGTTLSPTFLESMRSTDRPVRQVMVAPVKTVSEDTPIEEIAELLETHRIKRVPVVRDGRMVGIVSRANLLRALATRKNS